VAPSAPRPTRQGRRRLQLSPTTVVSVSQPPTLPEEALASLADQVTSRVLANLSGACALPEVRAPLPSLPPVQQEPTQPGPGQDVVPEDVASEAVNALLYSGESPPTQVINLSTTPLALHIDDKIKERIKLHKFVEFRSLLPGNSETEYTIKVNPNSESPALRLAPSNTVKNISTLEAWQTAFTNYHYIFIQAHPNASTHLLKYSEVLKELAQKFGINALNYYDRNFRLLREQNPSIQFSDIHSELWIRATALSPNSFPSSKNRLSPRTNQNGTQPRGVCFTYNSSGAFCHAQNCRFMHKCSLCFAGHPRYRCPRLTADPTTRSGPRADKPRVQHNPPTTPNNPRPKQIK